MKTSYKVVAVATPFAIAAFILGRVIWPAPAGVAGPSASLLPHFLFISALEAIAFGVGISFAFFGWRDFRSQITADRLSLATFIAVTWSLISWWPHDNMHRVNGMENYTGLIRIEYLFHFTLIVGGFVTALYFVRQLVRVSVSGGND